MEHINLANAGDGALARLFDEGIEKIAADFRDDAKDPDKKRELSLVLTFQQVKGGEIALLCSYKVKLSPRLAKLSVVHLDRLGKFEQFASPHNFDLFEQAPAAAPGPPSPPSGDEHEPLGLVVLTPKTLPIGKGKQSES